MQIAECMRKLPVSVGEIAAVNVDDSKVLLMGKNGKVLLLDSRTMHVLHRFSYTEREELRRGFRLPCGLSVLHGFNLLEVFDEKKGSFIEQRYHPSLDSIERVYPLHSSCLIMAFEWQSSFERHRSTNKLIFIRPETVESFHELKAPQSDYLPRGVILRNDSSFVMPACDHQSSDRKKYAIKSFRDRNGDYRAFLDSSTLTYSDLLESVTGLECIVVGIDGSIYGLTIEKDLLVVADQSCTYDGEYEFPGRLKDFRSIHAYEHGNILFLTESNDLVHVDLEIKTFTHVELNHCVNISRYTRYPFAILDTKDGISILYDMRRKQLLNGSFTMPEYSSLEIVDDLIFLSEYQPDRTSLVTTWQDAIQTKTIEGIDPSCFHGKLKENMMLFSLDRKSLYELNTDLLREVCDGK